MAPHEAWPYVHRIAIYSAKGDQAKVVADATRAIEVDPKCAAAYCNRASAYAALGKFDEAVRDDTRAIELDPKLAPHFSSGGSPLPRLETSTTRCGTTRAPSNSIRSPPIRGAPCDRPLLKGRL